MNLFKKIPVDFEGKGYEIRVLYDDTMVNVAAFLDNHPANGFRYQVKLSKNVDISGILKNGPIEDLVEMCKRDIVEKRWDKWRPLIQKNT